MIRVATRPLSRRVLLPRMLSVPTANIAAMHRFLYSAVEVSKGHANETSPNQILVSTTLCAETCDFLLGSASSA